MFGALLAAFLGVAVAHPVYPPPEYTVEQVEFVDGARFVLSSDPGFEYDPDTAEARFLYHPHETLPGPITWTVWP